MHLLWASKLPDSPAMRRKTARAYLPVTGPGRSAGLGTRMPALARLPPGVVVHGLLGKHLPRVVHGWHS